MSGRYQILVREQVGPALAASFTGFTVRNGAAGGAVLTGYIADQAALWGVLQRIFDLGLTLVALRSVE